MNEHKKISDVSQATERPQKSPSLVPRLETAH